jgi:C1A family cysteine protease
MSKLKKLAIFPVLALALLGTSYAASSGLDLPEEEKAVGSAPLASLGEVQVAQKSADLPVSAKGRRYGFLPASQHPKSQAFLSSHKVTTNGNTLLASLLTENAGSAKAPVTATTAATTTTTLPTSWDMRVALVSGATNPPTAATITAANATFPVFNQGQLGSCTANATAGAVWFCQLRDKMANPFAPSRLADYYNERALEDSIPYDAGATVPDSISVLISPGVLPEANWPYTDQTTTSWLGGVFASGTTAPFTQKPVGTYTLVDTGVLATAQVTGTGTTLVTNMQTLLIKNIPLVIGVEIWSSFESAAVDANGIVPMPSSSDTLLGGHALMVTGFNNSMTYSVTTTSRGKTTTTSQTGSFFIVRNSWGASLGAQGYYYLPYAYIESSSLTSEVYMVTAVAAG